MAPVALADTVNHEGIAPAAHTKSLYKIASIPADGIGPEVVEAGVAVLKAIAKKKGTFSLEFTDFDWSSDRYKQTGSYLPENHLVILRQFDAILYVLQRSFGGRWVFLTEACLFRRFGAVGAPDVPDHISLWGLRLAICQPLQQYANVR